MELQMEFDTFLDIPFSDKSSLDREMQGYRRLACAVILQWVEDFLRALEEEKKKRERKERGEKIYEIHKDKRESLQSLYKWPWTEYAEFWCDVAGHDVKKLQRLALELKELFSQNGKKLFKQKGEHLLIRRLLKEFGRLKLYEEQSHEENLRRKKKKLLKCNILEK